MVKLEINKRIARLQARWRNQNGFTLTELMAVLAILALLLAIASPAIGEVLNKSKTSADKSSIELMENAGELAKVDGLAFDAIDAELPEEDSYKIPTLVEAGYLKLDAVSKFHKPENYVMMSNGSGAFIYMGTKDGEVVAAPEPEPPAPVTTPEDYFVTTPVYNGIKITDYIGPDTDIVIPGTIGGTPVSQIGDNSFKNGNGTTKLTTVVIPDSVQTIGIGAFTFNSLTSVTLPNNSRFTYIGQDAFSNNLLTTVDIPDTVQSVGAYSFAKNTLKSVSLSDELIEIGPYAFQGNDLISVRLPDKLSTIFEYAFYDNELSTITVPDSVTRMMDGIFGKNYMTSFTLSKNIKTIPRSTFQMNRFVDIVIPAHVTAISASAFGNGGGLMKSVTIPDSIVHTNIHAEAFTWNKGLLLKGPVGGTAELYERSHEYRDKYQYDYTFQATIY